MRALLLAIGLLFLTASTALAHASLMESEPADDGVVEGTPSTFSATFDEELDVERSRIVVRNAAGDEVARGGVGDDPLVMTVALPLLPAGDYVARWTALTPDDQAVTRGTIEFTVEVVPQPPAAAPTAPVTPPAATSPPTSPASPSAASPAASPAPATASAEPPAASPAPSPVEPGTDPGTGDLLIALVIAGVLLGGLVLYLVRR